MNHGIEFDGD